GSTPEMIAKIMNVKPPSLSKMVGPKGDVIQAGQGDIATKQQAGYTLINPDGSFYPQNIRGEDPLDTERRRQRIYQALTPQEQAGQRTNELKDFGSTGLNAALATVSGAAGATAAGAAGDATAGFLSEVGKHIAKHYAGQTGAKIAADFLINNSGKLAA